MATAGHRHGDTGQQVRPVTPGRQVRVLVLTHDQEPLRVNALGLLQRLHRVQGVRRAGPPHLDGVDRETGFVRGRGLHHGDAVLARDQGALLLPRLPHRNPAYLVELQMCQRGLGQRDMCHVNRVETPAHQANAALSRKTLECTQLAQQVLDLQERLAAEERHRQSLEEKHQHARQALEHFRQSSKEQREQDQRKHEQHLQYLQGELRSVNDMLASKRQEAVHTLQENARLLGDLSRAQNDLHNVQEEVRGLRPLREALGLAQRRTEELGQHLVERDAALERLGSEQERLQARVDGLLTEKQQLELILAEARSSVAAQEQIVARVLERFVAATRATETSVRPATEEDEAKPTGTDA